MRDKERLNNFYDIMRILHKNTFPDWRFGQLISNFFGWIYQEKKRDIFYIEEKEMLEYFEEYCASFKK
jgi:hypothetical protein